MKDRFENQFQEIILVTTGDYPEDMPLHKSNMDLVKSILRQIQRDTVEETYKNIISDLRISCKDNECQCELNSYARYLEDKLRSQLGQEEK